MADVESRALESSKFTLNGLGLLGEPQTGDGPETTAHLEGELEQPFGASDLVSNGLLGGGIDTTASSSQDSDENARDSLATTSFVANGLLGVAVTGDAAIAVHAKSLDSQGYADVSVSNSGFVTNGLLGGPSIVDSHVGVQKSDFVTNGLLGTTLDECIADASSSKDDMGASFEASMTDTSSTFVSNGLLGSMESTLVASTIGAPASTEDFRSQEEDLPSVSQLLHRYGLGDGSSSSGAYAITATNYEGKSILLRKKRKIVKTASTALESRTTANLLEVPMHKLKEQLSESGAQTLADGPSTSASTSCSKSTHADLWVDRYRPKRFTDLLGDERVHRETMAWLKEWDYCVFKKKKPGAKKNGVEKNGGNGEFKYQDPYNRPWEKILLLSGPAGLGKTTLAHVAARHAGYDVLEINASDARSGQVIEDRIQPALESGSAIGAKRPVCVVIDEIDGATGAGDNTSTFVHKLISLTFGRGKRSKSKKKDEKSSRPLLRPIICICNDLYSSALTKLRQHARIIRFNRPADIHVTKRLRYICEYEGLRADSRALTTLVGLAKGDMRSCLNTLQFIRSRSADVTEPQIRTAAAGLKEADASSSTVLKSLFSPLPKRRVKELGLSEEAERRYVGRLSADLDASGTLDKIAVGCFEHYAKLRHYEATLSRHEKAADWLMHYDTFSGTMKSEREYALLPYLSYTLVPFYHLFHERGGEKVERPTEDWEAHVKTKTSEEILKSMFRCLQSAATEKSVGLRHLLSNQIMQLEFIPYINRIIAPPLRPVNSQVTKPSERALLSRLVDIMVSLEMRFIEEKTEEGQMVYVLDPPIDNFITYDGKRAPDVAVPRYAVRHLVATEIDAQLIAKQADTAERNKGTKPSFFNTEPQSVDEVPGIEQDDENADGATGVSNSNSALAPTPRTEGQSLSARKRKAEELDPAEKPPVDFFGRPIAVPAKKKQATSISIPVVKPYKISFRYNEGNSAAVRKPVKVSSFL